MSSKINTLSDLHRDILYRLMEGWHTTDPAKHRGFATLSELATEFAIEPAVMRQELALLELFGYVDNVHSLGLDQTQYYKRIGQTSPRQDDAYDPSFFITENGKRLVLAHVLKEGGDATAAR